MKQNNKIYSINLIVENQNYRSSSDQVICPICNELKLDAKITNCSGNCQVSVCGECSKKINKCPLCRAESNWDDYLIIKQLLSSLDFKCEKCSEIFHFEDFKDHYATHEVNNNLVILNDINLQLGSNERISNSVSQDRVEVRNNVPRNRENNNNNSEQLNCCCKSLEGDCIGKINNFIIFY